MQQGKRYENADMPHVTVIGAGIVGACAARAAQLSGADVTIIDRNPPGSGCSFGNAGVISTLVSTVQPPGPRMLKQIRRLLFSKDSPARIPVTRIPELAPWLLACAVRCTEKDQRATAVAMASLLKESTTSYDKLVMGTRAERLMRRNGSMGYFRTEEIFEKDRWRRDLARELGAEMIELDRHEIRQMEPSITDNVARATLFPTAYSTPDPGGFVQAIIDVVVENGGSFRLADVTGFKTAGGRVTHAATSKGEVPVDQVVIASGAYSGDVLRHMGVWVKLNTERGFHIELPEVETALKRPGMHYEHAYGIQQMNGGLRIAGAVEFGGLGRAKNMDMCDLLWKTGKTVLRETEELDAPKIKRWSGFRPTMPDFRPVLGATPGIVNCWLAFGHQHLGLTLAARSGLAIADLILGRDPGVDLSPFRADRF